MHSKEAERRLKHFLHSLAIDLPSPPPVESMVAAETAATSKETAAVQRSLARMAWAATGMETEGMPTARGVTEATDTRDPVALRCVAPFDPAQTCP